MAGTGENIQDPPQQPDAGGVEPARAYYDYLRKNGADTPPTYDSFKKTLSDPAAAQQYYGYLKKNGFDTPPTYESFSKTLGITSSSPNIAFPGAPQDYADALNNAPGAINNIAALPDFNKAIAHNDAQNQKAQSLSIQQKYQNGQINDEEYNAAQTAQISNLFEAKDRQAKISQDIQANPQLMRQTLSTVRDQNPKLAGDIEANLYLIDSRSRAHTGNTAQIMDNYKKIQNRELEYNPQTQQVEKPLGFWDAAANAIGKRHDDMADFDFYSEATPEEALHKFMTDRSNEGPDVPVEKGKGALGYIGEQSGAMVIPVAKTIIGGAAGAVVGGPGGAVVGGALANAHEFAKRAWINSFKQKYGELLDKGEDPTRAFIDAQRHATVDGLIGGAVGGSIGTIAPELDAELPLVQQVAENKGLSEVGKELTINGGARAQMLLTKLANKTPSGILNAGIAMGGQAAENIHNNKPISDNLFESGAQMLTLHYLMGALVPGENKNIKPAVVDQIADGLSKLDPDKVNAEVQKMVLTGAVTKDQGNEIIQRLDEQREINKGMPDNVPEENKPKIQRLIKLRTALQNQMDPEHSTYVDEAKHPEIKEQIDGVKKTNADGTTEGKDGINEQIRQLMKPEKKEPIVTPFKDPNETLGEAEPNHTVSWATPTNIKPKENAVQESETGTVLQREPEEAGSPRSERGGMEQRQQGEETPNPGENEEKIKAIEDERASKLKEMQNPKPVIEAKEVDAAKIARHPERLKLEDLHTRIMNGLDDLKKVSDCLW
jgi:hypothetical protein